MLVLLLSSSVITIMIDSVMIIIIVIIIMMIVIMIKGLRQEPGGEGGCEVAAGRDMQLRPISLRRSWISQGLTQA